MRLKKLILQGFKSFADRTEFLFDSPITGIVGPNGCGKSNVVDGFKWVLGEQSAKSLRGDAMMDVIFNGSGGRKPAGLAEVTLVFENPKREVWPHQLTRVQLAFAALFPAVADWVMARYYRDVRDANPK